MDKLKKIVEQVGKRRPIEEALPKVDGVHLRKGMKIQLKSQDEMLKNHYYEPHPQQYKKLIQQIAGTTQEVETVAGSYKSFSSNNIKLVGIDLEIEEDDIESIVDFAGKTAPIAKQHMEKLKFAVEDAVSNYLSNKTNIDSRNLSRKELGKIIRDIADTIAREGTKSEVVH